MSGSLVFSQTPGPLGNLFATSGVSHAVSIPLSGHLVVTSGQPGFNLEKGELVTSSLRDEFDACLDCVDAALKSAGVAGGILTAHRLTTYLTDVRDENILMEAWKARSPKHRPCWVTIGVNALAVPGMRIEMTAEAQSAGNCMLILFCRPQLRQ